ncbi:MAG: PilN domain-containing protein [Gammaproteobacteria bacterium]|jgi:type IV pilus assembly protein PilN
MAHINLLPWREELRKQQQKEFVATAVISAVLAGLIVLLAHLHVSGLIDAQKERNAFLENEIDILNQRIGRIKELEAMKADLLARMNVIQELQGSRPESVHLMDELVRSLPEGVYLKTFTQAQKNLSMVGVAQSNARVSDYMRNIDSSQWLSDPRLVQIVSSSSKNRRFANFTLRGKQKERKQQYLDKATSGDAP